MMTIDDARRELALDKKILRMLQTQLKKEFAAAEKEKQKNRDLHREVLETYRSLQEIEDAYGYDCITEAQYDKLRAAWESAHDETSSHDDFIEYLRREYSRVSTTAREMELAIKGEVKLL